MIHKLKLKFLNSPEWIISICVFFVYWFVNKSYTGPAFLDDEIGYLANAALISGHIIDGANSWHAGYSFFLAPLFHIFSEPSHIWQAAMVLNALIWSISFLLLARILKTLVPELSKQQLLLALLISAVYPAWITMSGFVFATTAFVFVYLLSILALLFWKPNKSWTIIPHCLLVGYLYWIHPVGLAVCIASFMVVGFVSIREKKYISALLGFILVIGLITLYNEVIDKWLIILATPEGYNPFFVHYPDSEKIISRLFNYEFWLHFAIKSAGQISYLIVSSFGLVLFGFIKSLDKSYRLIQKPNKHNGNNSDLVNQSIFAFLSLSLLGVLAVGVIIFSGTGNRVDHWIYGRYNEMVILPLLALGYLSFWKKKWLYGAAFFVFLTGLALSQIADMSAINNSVNTAAFWPQYVIWETNFIYWMSAGAMILVLVGKAWKNSKFGSMLAIIFVMLCFIISTLFLNIYHHNTLEAYSKPSTFVDIIREKHPPGSIIGFNLDGTGSLHTFQKQRYHLYLFYLYEYSYRRMSPEEWLKNYDGLYFTYCLDELYKQQGVKLVGKEMYTNLYLLAKNDGPQISMPDMSKANMDIYPADGWSIDYTISHEGSQLANMAGPVGNYEDGSIYSTGNDGFLLIDSEKRLGPGEYNFVLKGVASVADGSWADVTSYSGRLAHAKFNIKERPEPDKNVIASGTFVLEEPIHNLEVRVYAGSADELRIDGYEIEYFGELGE